jgi:hypothetical protein
MKPSPLALLLPFPLLALLLAAAPAPATTWIVLPDGTGDFPTIQAALDAAASGDVVELGDGTFVGAGNRDLDFQGKDLTLRSASGNAAACEIDADPVDDPGLCHTTGIFFRHGEGSGASVEDLTIRGAVGTVEPLCATGNGIRAEGGESPTIRNLVVRDNWGIGIGCGGPTSAATIVDCEVTGNGGGLYASGTATITGCTVTLNSAVGSHGGGIYVLGNVTVEDCVVTRNVANGFGNGPHTGGGLYAANYTGTIRGCLIAENEAGDWGGGIRFAPGCNAVVEESTIASNTAAFGGGVYSSEVLSLDASIVWGNCGTVDGVDLFVSSTGTLLPSCSVYDPATVAGGGLVIPSGTNWNQDPLFCFPCPCGGPPDSYLYTLREDSPVLGAGCGNVGGLGEGCTIAVEAVTWGELKSRYR